MVKRFFLVFYFYIFSIFLTQEAQAITVQLAQEDVALVGQPFIIKVTVDGASRNTDVIEIAGLDKFTRLGQSQSTNVSLVNGNVTGHTTHFYTVQAPSEGVFTVGPAKVRDNGSIIESNTLSVQVKKESGQQDSNNSFRCTMTTDKTDVVVGEPILLTLSIYMHGQVLQLGIDNTNFSGFSVKEIKQHETKKELIDNISHDVIKKYYQLYPLNQGTITINPVSVTAVVPAQRKRQGRGFFADDFFEQVLGHNTEQKRVNSNDIKINVSPVPSTNTKANGIGVFNNFSMSLDKQEAFTNEPILLTLTISGKGNFDQIATPKLVLPAGFKYYESKTSTEENLESPNQDGKKRFEFVLQSTKPGDLVISPQALTFYDTESKKFKTIKTAECPLVIRKREEDVSLNNTLTPEPGPSPKKELETKTKDINFIQEKIQDKKNNDFALPIWLFFIFLLVPILLFYKKIVSCFRVIFKKLKRGQSQQKILAEQAKKLDLIIKNGDACALYQFFLNFLAIKYGYQPEAITEDLIEQRLNILLWDRTKISDFIDYLSQCSQLNFSSQKITDIQQQSLLKKAKYWLLLLNN